MATRYIGTDDIKTKCTNKLIEKTLVILLLIFLVCFFFIHFNYL
jgi:hypothetical protein